MDKKIDDFKQTTFPGIHLEFTGFREDTIEAGQKAMEHWKYMEKLFETHGLSEKLIDVIRFHYTSAFIHGWKHGVEYAKKGE